MAWGGSGNKEGQIIQIRCDFSSVRRATARLVHKRAMTILQKEK